MKINYFLAFLFLAFISVVVIANINDTNLIGCTELNGNGCVCHTVERDTSVSVWVEGPDTLYVGQTGYYKMFMAGGPAKAGGYNVAGRFGEMVLTDSFSYQHPMAMNELTQAFSLPFPTTQDTIYWAFGYKAYNTSPDWDTIYSCGLSLVWDTIPDFHDRWDFGPKFPVRILSITSTNENAAKPEEFILYQNYPNPFNPKTRIQYQLSKFLKVLLKVYDILGNEVTTLINEGKSPGKYEISFDGTGLPSGIYYYQLQVNEFVETKKMVLVK